MAGLLHIDGSKHQWFGDERWYDSIVILDDATNEIYDAQLMEEEEFVSKRIRGQTLTFRIIFPFMELDYPQHLTVGLRT